MECKISEVSELACLKGLKDLQNIDLSGTPLSEKDKFREQIFDLLPQVQVINQVDREGNKVDLSEDMDEDDFEDDSEEEEFPSDEMESDDEEGDEDEDEDEDEEDDEEEDEEEEEN